MIEIIVDENDIRIDKYLSNKMNLSRNKLIDYFKNNLVNLNGKYINKPSIKVFINDKIIINDFNQTENIVNQIEPYDYQLNILYEDEYFWVVYKPSNMLSHPTSFNETNTLINAMKYNFSNFNKFYLVHRLDKDTSGLIIIAKDYKVQILLQKMFEENKIVKKYYAIVHNWFNNNHIIIDAPICRSFQNKLYFQVNEGKNCKQAKTEVYVLKNLNNNLALVDILLHTGRTHQIRVHLKYIKHPILNDPIYSNDKINNKYHQYLMSYCLNFIHPFNNKEINICIDFDKEFRNELQKLGYFNENN